MIINIYRAEEEHTYPVACTGIRWGFTPIPSSMWCPVGGYSGAHCPGSDTPFAAVAVPDGARLGATESGDEILLLPGESSGIPAGDVYSLARDGYYGLRLVEAEVSR